MINEEILLCEIAAVIPKEIEKAAAWHEFHDDHNGLLLNADADEADDVGMIVLLQYPSLLQELLFLFVRAESSGRSKCFLKVRMTEKLILSTILPKHVQMC